MASSADLNRKINMSYLVFSVLVFGTGLIMFTEFHVGGGAFRGQWLGLGKGFWLGIHQMAAIGFLAGCAVHLQRHWKYLKTIGKQWGRNLPKTVKIKTLWQSLLLSMALVVICAGFFTWIAMPGASLFSRRFHNWIDVHNIVGLFFLGGTGLHVVRRWWRIFPSARSRETPRANEFGETSG